MKAFFLRELAFVMAPALMVTRFKNMLSMLIGVMIMSVLIAVLAKTLAVFVLAPAGWLWLGLFVGVGASAVLLGYFLMFVV